MAKLARVLASVGLWQSVIAETLGTFFLVLVGTGSSIGGWQPDYKPSVVHISLAVGLVVASMVQALAHVSGCHINPAITCGMMATGKMRPLCGCIYVAAQCVGAVCASAVLRALTPEDLRGPLGRTKLDPLIGPAQGFCVEFLITFMLVLVVFGAFDPNRTDQGGSAPLAIGLAATAGHLLAIKYTGSSMNPARSLGPAVITGEWNEHWVYWVGPCLGGIAAAVVYQNIFQAPSPEDACIYHPTPKKSQEKDKEENQQELLSDRTTSI